MPTIQPALAGRSCRSSSPSSSSAHPARRRRRASDVHQGDGLAGHGSQMHCSVERIESLGSTLNPSSSFTRTSSWLGFLSSAARFRGATRSATSARQKHARGALQIGYRTGARAFVGIPRRLQLSLASLHWASPAGRLHTRRAAATHLASIEGRTVAVGTQARITG